jgi:poly(3-hydroxybutyrate) depolymerase
MTTTPQNPHTRRLGFRRGSMLLVALAALCLPAATAPNVTLAGARPTCSPTSTTRMPSRRQLRATNRIRLLAIEYVAHDGRPHGAYVAVPRWYGPHRNPPLPLVISPHGRGGNARANMRLFGNTPGFGNFIVICPEGQGRVLQNFSWGYRKQIDDLARMPRLARRALPWLRINPHRIYALGGSMGGQESLLLGALHPRLLAGVVAFDSLVDFTTQYHNFPKLRCLPACRKALGAPIGTILQAHARVEVGGSPTTTPRAYAGRSPLTHARRLAFGRVPLQIWWSTDDLIVVQPERQSGALFRRLRRLNPNADVEAYVGTWRHTLEMHADARLPFALARFGLLPENFGHMPGGMQRLATPGAGAV